LVTKQITVQRLSVISPKSFGDVVAGLEAAVGHPDMNALWRDIFTAKTFADLEKAIHKVIGPSGLMEFTRFNHGMVLSKEYGEQTPKCIRFLIGNPLIMKQMVEHVPDAGSYAPVTILIDERPDGVHLSYDTMGSLLASYANPQALKAAKDLDSKVESLLTSLC